jgi:hypothetical protein
MHDFDPHLVHMLLDLGPAALLFVAGFVLALRRPKASSLLVLIGFLLILAARLARNFLGVDSPLDAYVERIVGSSGQLQSLAFYVGRLGATLAGIGLIWHAFQLKYLSP